MKCEKCGGEWNPPKNISASLVNCPFCRTPILNVETASGYTKMGDLLKCLVLHYGIEIYKNPQKLNNLIADLYRGNERLKRIYRHAILDDLLAQRIYELSVKPLNEREVLYHQIISWYSEANFFYSKSSDKCLEKQIVDSFVNGLQLKISPTNNIEIAENSIGIDVSNVIYSADKETLIRGDRFLKSYNILDGTITIYNMAFMGCHLRRITIPNSVRNIKSSAFYRCEFLESISIPNSVTCIGNCAFDGCSSLKSIILPDAITSIGYATFYDCSSLAQLTIPNKVKNIDDYAFYGCSSLSNIFIPASITSIGKDAFAHCSSLKQINIPKGSINTFKRLLESQFHNLLKEVLYM